MSLLNAGVNVMGKWDKSDKWDRREESHLFIPRNRLIISFILAGSVGFCTAFIVMGILNIIKSF